MAAVSNAVCTVSQPRAHYWNNARGAKSYETDEGSNEQGHERRPSYLGIAPVSTRVSFTTVATQSAAPPTVPAAATTCATSWIDPLCLFRYWGVT